MSKKALIILLILALPLIGWWLLAITGIRLGSSQPPAPEFVLYARQPEPVSGGSIRPGNWNSPTAVATIGNRVFVLDMGNDRILELDHDGKVVAVLCETGDCQFLLKDPQAMAAHDGKLYVANTGAGGVVVLSLTGSVVEEIKTTLPGADESEGLRPSGIAVSQEGDVFVSDATRNVVLRLSKDGRVPSVFLASWADSEKYRANGPIGLTLDAQGNLYVANSGDGVIRMYSPGGRHLHEFAMRSNPVFFSPAYVAVDPEGDVYFTDNRSRMIYVYNPMGDLVGTVGFLDARRVDSPGVLRDPQGLQWDGGVLYVADRTAGLFAFKIDPRYWQSGPRPQLWAHP